jgi:hypothetical protein
VVGPRPTNRCRRDSVLIEGVGYLLEKVFQHSVPPPDPLPRLPPPPLLPSSYNLQAASDVAKSEDALTSPGREAIKKGWRMHSYT